MLQMLKNDINLEKCEWFQWAKEKGTISAEQTQKGEYVIIPYGFVENISKEVKKIHSNGGTAILYKKENPDSWVKNQEKTPKDLINLINETEVDAILADPEIICNKTRKNEYNELAKKLGNQRSIIDSSIYSVTSLKLSKLFCFNYSLASFHSMENIGYSPKQILRKNKNQIFLKEIDYIPNTNNHYEGLEKFLSEISGELGTNIKKNNLELVLYSNLFSGVTVRTEQGYQHLTQDKIKDRTNYQWEKGICTEDLGENSFFEKNTFKGKNIFKRLVKEGKVSAFISKDVSDYVFIDVINEISNRGNSVEYNETLFEKILRQFSKFEKLK